VSDANDPLERLRSAVRRLECEVRDRPPNGRRHDDADDVYGTMATDDAIGFDPEPLLTCLHHHGARVVVIGQVAGIMHGSGELTGDLDLLWDGTPREAPRLAAAFAEAGAQIADDDGRPLPCTAESFLLPKIVFRTPGASGDCCTPGLPWGALPVASFITRANVASTHDGRRVFYVARDDLIAMRLAVGRPKDLRRAQELTELPNKIV
jgi:hypothetical protein